MVTMAQSAANWRNTLNWIARIHSHTYINTVTTTLCLYVVPLVTVTAALGKIREGIIAVKT